MSRKGTQANLLSWDVVLSNLKNSARSRGSLQNKIHDLRVAIKTTRALLRLVQREVSASTFDHAELLLKDAADELAVFRDPVVLKETLTWFLKQLAPRLRRKLKNQLHPLSLRLEIAINLKSMKEAQRANRARLNAVLETLLRLSFPDFPKTVQAGMDHTYGCARKAFKKACKSKNTDDLHKWRRWTKYLLLQITSFYPHNARERKELVGDLDNLQKRLGDHHDLDVLAKEFEKHSQRPKALRIANCELRSISRKLAEKCLKKGRRVFGIKPRQFIRCLSGR